MKNALVLMGLCCVLALPAEAAVYRWLGPDGVVHYSDQPVAGAKKVQLPESSHYAPPTYSTAAPAAEKSGPAQQPSAGPYRSFRIDHPADRETLHNATGDVPVVMTLDPDLRKGDQIQLVLDGLGARETVDSVHAVLKHIERGAHTLQAEVLDAKGRTLIRAIPVRFYLLMPTTKTPAAGASEGDQQPSNPNYPGIPQDKQAFPSDSGGGKAPVYGPAYPEIPSGDQTFSPTRPGAPGYTPSYGGAPSQPSGTFSPVQPASKPSHQPSFNRSH